METFKLLLFATVILVASLMERGAAAPVANCTAGTLISKTNTAFPPIKWGGCLCSVGVRCVGTDCMLQLESTTDTNRSYYEAAAPGAAVDAYCPSPNFCEVGTVGPTGNCICAAGGHCEGGGCTKGTVQDLEMYEPTAVNTSCIQALISPKPQHWWVPVVGVVAGLAFIVAVVSFHCFCCESKSEGHQDAEPPRVANSKVAPTPAPAPTPTDDVPGELPDFEGTLPRKMGTITSDGKKPSLGEVTNTRSPKGDVRGMCTRCSNPVYETEERQKDERGGYFHTNPENCPTLQRVQRGSILLPGQEPAPAYQGGEALHE